MTFNPPVPPAEFVNLVLWLDAPPESTAVSEAIGRLSSSDSSEYWLWAESMNPFGESLLGVSDHGEQIWGYAPENRVEYRVHNEKPPFLHLRDLRVASEPSLQFEITLEAASSSPNPDFQISDK